MLFFNILFILFTVMSCLNLSSQIYNLRDSWVNIQLILVVTFLDSISLLGISIVVERSLIVMYLTYFPYMYMCIYLYYGLLST